MNSVSIKEDLTPVEETLPSRVNNVPFPEQIAAIEAEPKHYVDSPVAELKGAAPSQAPSHNGIFHMMDRSIDKLIVNNEQIAEMSGSQNVIDFERPSDMHGTQSVMDDDHENDHKEAGTENQVNLGEPEVKTEEEIEEDAFKEKMKIFNDKQMSKEELATFVEEVVRWIDQQSDCATKQVASRLKMIDRSYHVYRSHREAIAQRLVDVGFPELSVKLSEFFNLKGVFATDEIWFPTFYTYHVAWNFSDASHAIAKALAEKGFLKILLANASHQPYIDNLGSKNVTALLKSSLSTLHNMAKHPEIKHIFTENNAVQILKPYMKVDNEFLQAVSCMALAHIIEEGDNDILKDTGCIKFIATCLRRALSNTKTRRHRGFDTIELVDGMAHLAVNDDNKQKVVDAGTLSSLVIMMKEDKTEEQIIAARCVWTLSFDTAVRQRIVEEEGCIEALQMLSSSENDTVRKMAKGALWQIEGRGEQEKESEDEDDDDREQSSEMKHIFVSYNHTHQDVVKKVAERLKNDKYKVWLDIEQMGGDMIEAMAEAIENAEAMIVCMSEQYKLSPDCQSEARYAYRRRIPLIPLMLQRYYKPDGWLGFLLGAKLYINFDGKFTFDIAYKKLQKELEGLNLGGTGDQVDEVIQATTVENVGAVPQQSRRKTSHIDAWSKEQVAQWLEKQDLSRFKDEFSDYDGKSILGLKKIKEEAPEFFYSMLGKQIFPKLIDLVKFTTALDDLT